MYRLVHGQLLNIIEVVTPNQIALVTTTAYSVQGYDSDVPIEIESIPEKNEPPGKVGELHYTNGALEWVYVDKPKELSEEIAALKVDKEKLFQQVAEVNGNFAAFTDFYFTKNPDQA